MENMLIASFQRSDLLNSRERERERERESEGEGNR